MAAATLLALLVVAPAVARAEAMNASLLGGSLKIGDLDEVELEKGQLTVAGNVARDGTISVPKSGIVFRPLTMPVDLVGLTLQAKVFLQPLGPATGTLPPGGGEAAFKLPVRVKLEAYKDGESMLGPDTQCYMDPVDFDLTGPYDAASKRLTVSQPNLSLPPAGAGCSPLSGLINQTLNLPSDKNSITLMLALGAAKPGDGLGKLASAVKVKKALSVPVKCKAGGSPCAGTVQIVAGKVLAGKAYRVAAGKQGKVSVPLSKAALTRVKKAGKKGLKVVVRVLPKGAKKPAATKTLRLRG